MSGDLTNILVSVQPRETSGSRSSNRFDYQKDWALCKLLGLHSSQNDFLLLLDYHEDVVVLNSELNPNSAHFFQIKSKASGNWTVNSLIKNKGESDSILNKLFSNYKMCPNHAKSLLFVSNQGLSAKLKNGQKALSFTINSFSELSTNDKEKIHICIEGGEAKSCDIYGLSLLTVSKTELGIEDHVTHTKGKLVEFFETVYPDKKVSIPLCYKTLFDEIRRKTNAEIICQDFNSLKNKKGIGRTELESIIKLFVDHTNTEDIWAEVNQHLISEGFQVSLIRKIKTAWTKYSVERMDVNNEPLLMFRKLICDTIEEFTKTNSEYNFKTLLKSIEPKVHSGDVPNLKGRPFIVEAAILFEVMANDSV